MSPSHLGITKSANFSSILLDIYPVCSIMGDCPTHWIFEAIQLFSLISSMWLVIRLAYFILSLGVSGERFATESSIGHFGLWHGGTGVKYRADLVSGQHINDFYEHFHVYNR
jgi:hypothetical protein